MWRGGGIRIKQSEGTEAAPSRREDELTPRKEGHGDSVVEDTSQHIVGVDCQGIQNGNWLGLTCFE